MELLSKAGEQDVVLSKNSPLGIRFHYLKGTTAEREKLHRIAKDLPGSPCTEKYLVSNTEFTKEPICMASRAYQKRKIVQLGEQNLPEQEYEKQLQEVLAKECLCIGLSNAAIRKYKAEPFKNLNAINICPGPNIAYFTEIVSLKQMIDHIYGRINIIHHNNRPHMFIKELNLYIEYWSELLRGAKVMADKKSHAYIQAFYQNLMDGISYYRNLTGKLSDEFVVLRKKMHDGLEKAETHLAELIECYLALDTKEA